MMEKIYMETKTHPIFRQFACLRLIPYAHTRHGIIWATIIATAKSQTPKCWSIVGESSPKITQKYSVFSCCESYFQNYPPTSNSYHQDYYSFQYDLPCKLPSLPLASCVGGLNPSYHLLPPLRWEPRCQDKKMRSLWVRLG